MDDEFQAFLDEVDQLSINHNAESTSLEEVTNDISGDSDNAIAGNRIVMFPKDQRAKGI